MMTLETFGCHVCRAIIPSTIMLVQPRALDVRYTRAYRTFDQFDPIEGLINGVFFFSGEVEKLGIFGIIIKGKFE